MTDLTNIPHELRIEIFENISDRQDALNFRSLDKTNQTLITDTVFARHHLLPKQHYILKVLIETYKGCARTGSGLVLLEGGLTHKLTKQLFHDAMAENPPFEAGKRLIEAFEALHDMKMRDRTPKQFTNLTTHRMTRFLTEVKELPFYGKFYRQRTDIYNAPRIGPFEPVYHKKCRDDVVAVLQSLQDYVEPRMERFRDTTLFAAGVVAVFSAVSSCLQKRCYFIPAAGSAVAFKMDNWIHHGRAEVMKWFRLMKVICMMVEDRASQKHVPQPAATVTHVEVLSESYASNTWHRRESPC
ncbi:hypothetical protein BJ508DRAFT_307540 [Ascobolus immersus RN42]|uniref:F-box domain-containing protein n=1 Tax=Ascobolus immersus RN42 TaxID=1160509 RepID=A0A3N4I4E0_ASCIM|nr:hypothetical protein BJ508DRAFT_307540 [Ascobolus immersus RN42]